MGFDGGANDGFTGNAFFEATGGNPDGNAHHFLTAFFISLRTGGLGEPVNPNFLGDYSSFDQVSFGFLLVAKCQISFADLGTGISDFAFAGNFLCEREPLIEILQGFFRFSLVQKSWTLAAALVTSPAAFPRPSLRPNCMRWMEPL